MLTLEEMAAALSVHPSTVKQGAAKGLLVSQLVYNDKGQRLYSPPGEPIMIVCHRCGTAIRE